MHNAMSDRGEPVVGRGAREKIEEKFERCRVCQWAIPLPIIKRGSSAVVRAKVSVRSYVFELPVQAYVEEVRREQ